MKYEDLLSSRVSYVSIAFKIGFLDQKRADGVNSSECSQFHEESKPGGRMFLVETHGVSCMRIIHHHSVSFHSASYVSSVTIIMIKLFQK